MVSDGFNGSLYKMVDVQELAQGILRACEHGFSSEARETITERFNVDVNALKYLEFNSEID